MIIPKKALFMTTMHLKMDMKEMGLHTYCVPMETF